jgi:hypothetical protein
MFVLEHPETTVYQNKQKGGKRRGKEREKKRVSRMRGHRVEKEKTVSKWLVSEERVGGYQWEREKLRGSKEKGKKREREREKRKKERKGRKRDRVSTHIYPPPRDVRPRTCIADTGRGMLPSGTGMGRASGLLVNWYVRLYRNG